MAGPLAGNDDDGQHPPALHINLKRTFEKCRLRVSCTGREANNVTVFCYVSARRQHRQTRRIRTLPRPRIYRDNAEKQRAYRQRKRKRQPVQFRHKSDEWETPQELFDELDREFHFTTDAAAIPDNAKCNHFFTPAEDGLKQTWQGVCWLNPPYGLALRQWVRKAHASAQAGAVVVCLLPARTDTLWWHDYVLPHAEVRYIRGRMRFNGGENSAPFPSAIVIFRPSVTPCV